MRRGKEVQEMTRRDDKRYRRGERRGQEVQEVTKGEEAGDDKRCRR